MTNNTSEFFTYPQEIWDEKTCLKKSKSFATDGLGTKYPFRGYIGCTTSPYGYGEQRFNGGCVINGKWYKGVKRELPIIPKTFQIIKVPRWGFKIVRSEIQ